MVSVCNAIVMMRSSCVPHSCIHALNSRSSPEQIGTLRPARALSRAMSSGPFPTLTNHSCQWCFIPSHHSSALSLYFNTPTPTRGVLVVCLLLLQSHAAEAAIVLVTVERLGELVSHHELCWCIVEGHGLHGRLLPDEDPVRRVLPCSSLQKARKLTPVGLMRNLTCAVRALRLNWGCSRAVHPRL